MLQHDTDYLTREPTGVGLDVPAWLVALEEEVEDVLHAGQQACPQYEESAVIRPLLLSYDQARQQLDDWASRQAT